MLQTTKDQSPKNLKTNPNVKKVTENGEKQLPIDCSKLAELNTNTEIVRIEHKYRNCEINFDQEYEHEGRNFAKMASKKSQQ
jgi:hypothetical protein